MTLNTRSVGRGAGIRRMVGGRLRPGHRSVPVAVLVVVSLAACSGGEEDEYSADDASGAQTVSVEVPDLSHVAREGAELFTANCSECHGPTAGGSSQGPPLVHKIYEPGHHADFSFVRAVETGSPQHHWNFGDMEPVPGLSPEDLNKVICYVRELQYANGIFIEPAGLAACDG
ncbi:MAG: cytochrome c [bacterium]|nr:cytochrome c [bacterium]MDE0353993.1 cytochrome c [bacterium]